MKLLNTIRILSGALFISLCCLTASCNFLEIVPVEQADLDDATQDFNSTLGFLHSCYAGIQSPVAFEIQKPLQTNMLFRLSIVCKVIIHSK